ncbi:hypothetical protein DFH09DRAFT_1376322 [Mycena vulgaris]|nr:hypothetical protein DFH09DRAFT_1376322 [Mycena vulgaris]
MVGTWLRAGDAAQRLLGRDGRGGHTAHGVDSVRALKQLVSSSYTRWAAVCALSRVSSLPRTPVQIIDAIRIEDAASVALKIISQDLHPDEANIFKYFSSKGLTSDPRNHCIPLLSVLSPPDADDKLTLVMKLMRQHDRPRFDTFGEVMEFFRQAFEGIQFMHHHRVAHRDCNGYNIMMDGQHLFPHGFHPQYQDMKRRRTTLVRSAPSNTTSSTLAFRASFRKEKCLELISSRVATVRHPNSGHSGEARFSDSTKNCWTRFQPTYIIWGT